MTATQRHNMGCRPEDTLWIISKGRYADLDMRGILQGVETATVMDYRISTLAFYLLKPHPIQIKKRLVGSEVHYLPSRSRFKALICRILPRALQRFSGATPLPPLRLISDLDIRQTPFQDAGLEAHFAHLYEQLRPYDTLMKELTRLDLKAVSHITGICRDMNGHESALQIEGDIGNQIEYINANLTQEVDVVIEKAYLSKGLFEMSGFNFEKFSASEAFRLIKFTVDGKPRACVLGGDRKVIFWIDDVRLVYYLQILGQLLHVNPKLNESFELCRSGKAKALKLLFNRQVGIDYSAARLPGFYKDVIERYKVESKIRDVIANVISNHQFAVMFNYLPLADRSERRVFSNLSLMHNLRALEALKNADPQVYSEISNLAANTEVGKYYLLDCFRGYQE